MKNFTYFTLILLILSACSSGTKNSSDSADTLTAVGTARADSVTLNGYTFAEAETMVRSFRKDTLSTNVRTNIWFSKDYIDSLSKILPKENVDGFRIYFARKDGKNAIVMVATRDTTKKNSDGSISKIHQDYFELESDFFKTAGTLNTGKIENDTTLAGIAIASDAECNDNLCKMSPNGIACSQAKKWINNFGKGPVNIRNLWYSINLIHYWKNELDAAVKKGKKGDGIRIYFAKKDTGNNAFVMVTTRDNGKKYSDYYTCYSDNKSNKSILADDNGEECPNNCHGATWE